MLNPVDVAEQYATLDVITGGKLILGVGLGYRDEEFAAMQLDKKHRVGPAGRRGGDPQAALDRGQRVLQGKHFTLDNVSIAPKPLQKPAPADLVRRDRRQGHRAGGTPGRRLDRHLDDRVGRDEAPGRPLPPDAGRGRHGQGGGFAKCVELFIGDDKESALREAEPFIGAKYKAYYSWGMGDNVPGESGAGISDFADLTKNRFIVGGVEDVIDDCLYHRDVLGVTDLIVRLNFPGMPRELVRRNIERFATEVIPQVR